MQHTEETIATPHTKAAGKLVPSGIQDSNSKGEHLEGGHSNGDYALKNGDSQGANSQEGKQNGETHLRTQDVQAGFGMTHIDSKLETPSEQQSHLATKSESVLQGISTFSLDHPSTGNPKVNPKNGRYEIDQVARGREGGHKAEQGGLDDNPGMPTRELLATTSAPVRLPSSLHLLKMPISEYKGSHHEHAEGNEDGSDCTSPVSSDSDDMQSLSDQTGGATCGSGTYL